MRTSTVFTGDITPTFFPFRKLRCEVVLVGHMESSVDALDKTSMCMSTACVVHCSGGFDASGTMFTQLSIC